MSFWQPSLRIRLRCAAALLACAVAAVLPVHQARSQAADDALSQREVDSLRDAAFVPLDRLKVFEQILDDREKRIDELLAKRKGHTDFPGEMHDVLDQFGAIVDELNDNLDDYSRRHRDVRKGLPKLIQATERWSAAVSAPADDEAYSVVRKFALDNLKDTREIAESLQTDLDAYFKAHPDAEKEERKRNADPHAVRDESPQ